MVGHRAFQLSIPISCFHFAPGYPGTEFKNGIYQINEEELTERMLNELPQELIEELMKAELNNEEIDEDKLMDIIRRLDIDLF